MAVRLATAIITQLWSSFSTLHASKQLGLGCTFHNFRLSTWSTAIEFACTKSEAEPNYLLQATSLEFCILRQRFCPFHKGLEDFSGVRIQNGVAENPFLPGRMT